MWKPEHRRAAQRHGLRYPSDMTDAEWAIVAPLIPPARRGGTEALGEHARSAQRHLLCVVDGLPMEGAAQGPAAEEHGARLSRTVELGRHAGAHPSCALCRGARARKAAKPAPRRRSSTAKRQGRAQRGALLDPSGYDAGKKVKGRKRHILVDTLGLLLSVAVHAADIQDRDGAASGARQAHARAVSLHRAHLRRCRLSRAARRIGRSPHRPLDRRDRQTQRAPQIRRRAKAVDRRAHPGMDQPQPPPGARFRALCLHRRRLRSPRHDPHHAPPSCRKRLSMIYFFPDRLLGQVSLGLFVRDVDFAARTRGEWMARSSRAMTTKRMRSACEACAQRIS